VAETDPAEFTIEARLRACMVLANTLQQTARQTSPYHTTGDRNPFSVSLLVCLTPPFCQTLADHLLAVRLALGDPEAFRPAPAPSRAALRLGDVLTVSAGVHSLEIGLVERAEGHVLPNRLVRAPLVRRTCRVRPRADGGRAAD
jgi:hypothetical protein